MIESRRLRPTAVVCAALSALASLGGVGCSGDDDSADLDPPDGPREALAFVEDALAGDHGEPDGEAALVHAEVGADLLADFAADAPTGGELEMAGDRLAIGSAPAARFLALGMGTSDGRDLVGAAHRATVLDLAVNGLTAEQAGTASDWEERVGKLDAIVAAAEIIGRDLSDSDANEVTARAIDSEDRVVAAAHLVVALRTDADGEPDPALTTVLDVAESAMAPDALADVRAAVTGEFAEALRPDLPDRIHDDLVEDTDQLREAFAGHDEYPVDAAMSAVIDAHDRHLTAALDGRDEG